MLARNTFPLDYIESCRRRVDAQVATWKAGVKKPSAEAETVFFNNLVLVLELAFVHRLRGREGKNGNPLNEVRLLAASLLENDGRLVADKQIKLKPETSVLGLAVGDEIALTEADFARLSDAYFTSMMEIFGDLT